MNTMLPMRNFCTFLLLLALAAGPVFAQPVPISGCSSVVTTTADSGPGSLRAALECANNHPGFDVVTFAIPGPGPHTIQPASPLPEITEAVRVDGYTQPGASPNTLQSGNDARLRIEIDGSLIAGAGNGLVVRGGNSTLRGLVINRFNISGVGILLLSVSNTVEGCFLGTDVTGTLSRPNVDGVWMESASYNQIGRAAPAARNVISGNRYGGVGIDGGILNQVQGNYIGSDASGLNRLGNGTSDGNGFGLIIYGGGSLHLIGGANPGDGNLIADNKQSNLIIYASTNTVQGNWIGLDRTGTNRLNAGGYYGVLIQNAEDNLIGGAGPGTSNVISGNVRGINVASGTRNTQIVGNRIGTDPSGRLPLGNAVDGVHLEGGSVNTFVGGAGIGTGNMIAFNGQQGVKVSGSARGGRILGNSIHDNGQLGIDLVAAAVDQDGDGPTPNDALDADLGANDLQNFPVIQSATLTGSQVVLVDSLQSQPGRTYRVELFANAAADPSGYGEGRQWVGATNVTTDLAGYATFIGIFPAPAGLVFYSATATDIAAGQTSEFSKAVEAMPCSNALANQPCLPVRPGAVFIPGLFNTGVDNARAPLADDSLDPHYTLVTGSPIAGTPIVATSAGGFPIPPWLADNSSSTWIAPTASTYGQGATDGSAVYYYQIEFDLTGLDPSTAVITGQWSTDNYGSNILINGVSTGLANHSQFAAWTPFVISNGFVAGMNTLTFMVNNGYLEPAPDGPTGLRVEMTGTALFASPIPGLFNTGVDAAGTPQADDASEMHYTLAWASAVAGTPTVATSSGGFPIGPWLGDNSVSAWIAPSPTTDGPNATSGAANYFYQTHFDLTGRDPTTAVIEGQWATDNGGIDILINGVSTGQSNPSGFASWTPFRIAHGFLPGVNTLTFMVNNGAGEATASGPTGLRVEMRGRVLSSCVDFQTLPVMSVPNPWFYQGISFFARDFTGGPLAFPGIRRDGVFTGLNCGWQLEMDLPSPCNSVELTLAHFSAPAIATAYDASGTAVATAAMSGPQNMAQTLALNGLGITRVVIVAPSDETLLLGLCCRRGRPGPPRYDFNDCLLPSGTSFPGAGNVGRIADDGTGRNCVVHLTDANQGGAFGVFSIPPPFGGGNVDNIHMHWRSLVGGDNGAICDAAQFDRPGADGYSMSWGADLPNPPSIGNPGEEGAGTGLIVTVDTFDNGGGEAPGLEIKWRGTRVAFDDISPDPGLAKDFLRKNAFVEADLTVDTAGQATFTYDGRVLAATLAGWTGIAGGNIMFGARTGGACDNHWIDDLLIEEGRPVTSCGRNLSVVRNGNSVLITWDGGGILQSTPSLVPSSWADVPGNPAGSYVTYTTGSAQFFRLRLDCERPPIIIGDLVIPQQPRRGDPVQLTGQNLPDNPDDVCFVLEAEDGQMIPIENVAITQPGVIRGVIGFVPEDANGKAFRVKIGVGNGIRRPVQPDFADVVVVRNPWMWVGENVNMVAWPHSVFPAFAAPANSNFASGSPTADGKLCLIIDQDWRAGITIRLGARIHKPTDNGYAINFEECRFTGGGTRFDCAVRICDLLKKAFEARGLGVLCTVTADAQGNAKITLECTGPEMMNAGYIQVESLP